MFCCQGCRGQGPDRAAEAIGRSSICRDPLDYPGLGFRVRVYHLLKKPKKIKKCFIFKGNVRLI